MVPQVLCFAEEFGAAAYLKALAESWLREPPPFHWRLLLSQRANRAFQASPALARATTLPVNAKISSLQMISEGFRADGVLTSASANESEFSLIKCARTEQIPILQYIDNWYGYRARLDCAGEPVIGDRILVIDDAAVAEAVQEGIPKNILVAVGHPAWEGLMPFPEPVSRDILYASAPIERYYGRSLGYTNADIWETLQQAVKISNGIERVFYAPHPDMLPPANVSPNRLRRFDHNLLSQIGGVVSGFSAPLVDAFLMGRRAISLQPNAGATDMCPLSRHGRITRVMDAEECARVLLAPLCDASDLTKSLVGSSSRVTREIESLVEQE